MLMKSPIRTSYAMNIWHGCHSSCESDIMIIDYGCRNRVRRWGSITPMINEAGSGDSVLGSSSSGLRRMLIRCSFSMEQFDLHFCSMLVGTLNCQSLFLFFFLLACFCCWTLIANQPYLFFNDSPLIDHFKQPIMTVTQDQQAIILSCTV